MKKIILLLIVTLNSLYISGQGNLGVTAGTTVNSSNGAFLVLDNINLINDGSIKQEKGDGVLKFMGDLGTKVSGNGTNIFDRVFIEKKPFSIVTLHSSININSGLYFKSGLVNFGEHVINLGNTGMLWDETESSKAFTNGDGYLQSEIVLHAPQLVNPGNLGVLISTSSDPGFTVVRRGNVPGLKTVGTASSISRYYDIIPSNNSNLHATLRFKYLDGELNSVDESSLTIWEGNQNSPWTNLGVDIRNPYTNYLEKKGINGLSRFTLSSSADSHAGIVLKNAFIVWPNPVKDNAAVRINTPTPARLKFVLYDSKGALIKVQYHDLRAGVNQLDVNMNTLSQGSYLLQAIWGNVIKIVKLDKL